MNRMPSGTRSGIFRSVLQDHISAIIFLIAGMPDIIVNGKCNCTVSVNLLKCYFPFIMALLPVYCNHRVKSSSIIKSQFCSVLNTFLKMPVSVNQQVPRHFSRGSFQKEGKYKCFGIPVGSFRRISRL